eukprot:3874655-Amphidinium_carterae.1
MGLKNGFQNQFPPPLSATEEPILDLFLIVWGLGMLDRLALHIGQVPCQCNTHQYTSQIRWSAEADKSAIARYRRACKMLKMFSCNSKFVSRTKVGVLSGKSCVCLQMIAYFSKCSNMFQNRGI